MTRPTTHEERRSFERVHAEVMVRPASILAHAASRPVNDLSLGGLRCYSDEAYRAGQRLELELLFGAGASATVLAEVVWIEPLPAGAPARYDVGMRYLDASPESLALLRQAVRPHGA